MGNWNLTWLERPSSTVRSPYHVITIPYLAIPYLFGKKHDLHTKSMQSVILMMIYILHSYTRLPWLQMSRVQNTAVIHNRVRKDRNLSSGIIVNVRNMRDDKCSSPIRPLHVICVFTRSLLWRCVCNVRGPTSFNVIFEIIVPRLAIGLTTQPPTPKLKPHRS